MVINTVSVSWIPVILVHFCVAGPDFVRPCDDEPERSDPPGYNVASDMLMKSINLSADPCSNFYEFTCGRWRKRLLQTNNIRQSRFVEIRVYNKVKEVLESTDVFNSKSARTVKAMYRKCMDRKHLNGIIYLLKVIQVSTVPWPTVHGHRWRGELFDLTALLITFYKSRLLQVFVSFGVENDQKNRSRRLIWFSQGLLQLVPHRDYYLNREKYGRMTKLYKQHLIQMVELLHTDAGGASSSRRQIEYEIGEIMDFESKLAKIMVAEEDRTSHTEMYNLRRLSEMQALMPSVNWTNFFYSITPPTVHGYLAADPQIVIDEIDYMKRLTKLLNSTDSVIIANYVYVSYTLRWRSELGIEYHKLLQELNILLYGQSVTQIGWRDCVSRVITQMPSASGALYIKKAFDEETRNATLEMVSNVQEAFQDMLVENDWLDSSTKASALDKARNIQRVIGYPDFILDDKKLDDFYSELNITESDSYTEMTEKWIHWRISQEFKRLVTPADIDEVLFSPLRVTAFYVEESNTILISAAILQMPFFHQSFPKALNYGGIGNVIGREITLGFDDQGRQYDSHGILRDWWDDSVEKKFRKRVQCLIDQYNKIKVLRIGLNVNNTLTQREIIADHGGVKVAFKAYKNYLKKFGEERPLRGLEEYNSEQMFFIGYAAVSCEHQTIHSLIDESPQHNRFDSEYRVNQVLANQPEFAAAFKCSVGTPMNPTSRCAVW